MSHTNQDVFDHIIVGAGTAGCVLADRLSSDKKSRVLLVEAGPDVPPGTEPQALLDRGCRMFMLQQYFWPDLLNEQDGRCSPIQQAKVIGGGSTINGMHAQRGLPRDYDEWSDLGVEGWTWHDVLPHFKRLESDNDFQDSLHGRDGPIGIRRVPENQWSKLTLALRVALDKRGVPRLRDINTEPGDGTSSVPLNNTADARASTAVSYLTSTVRSRSNLRILANTRALRVSLIDNRVTGVELDGGRRVCSPHVILCAGAIHSPIVLLRSGIGPGDQLQRAGIRVAAERGGVGANLRNHPILSISCHVKRAGRQHSFRTVRPPVPMIVRYTSGVAEQTDMVLNLWERLPGPLADDPLGRQLAQMMIILNKSHSRGTVALNPSDPLGPPRIHANILSDVRDHSRMVMGFKFVCSMLSEKPMAELINHAFIPSMAMGIPPDRLTISLLQDNSRARLLSTLGAMAMDYVPGVRTRFMRTAGRPVASILAREGDLPEFIRGVTSMGGHPGGTCRLGAPTDSEAVVDSRCQVIGVTGLRVVDASIFPTLMTAGTNLPTIMAAEKAADMIIRDQTHTDVTNLAAI